MLKIQYPVRMEGRGEGGADDLYFWNENITEIIFHHNHSREFPCMRAHIYTQRIKAGWLCHHYNH